MDLLCCCSRVGRDICVLQPIANSISSSGFITGRRGGCGSLQRIGTFKNYVGVNRNGIHSVPFPSTFPLSYRFPSGSGLSHCEDLRDDALVFNILVTLILSLVLRPNPLVVCQAQTHTPRGSPLTCSYFFFHSYSGVWFALHVDLPDVHELQLNITRL